MDDDPALRAIVAALLAKEGYAAQQVGTAAAARLAIAGDAFDLVVLDFVLPDADGVQLLREWREGGVRIPVLALTGARSDAVTEGLLRAGAHDVIEKARIDAATLRRAIQGLAEPTPFPDGAPRPRAAPDDEPEPLAWPAPGRALVVDDVALARKHVRYLLEADGWRVDEAETAASGLRRAARGEYDVILLDQLLPDFAGVGLLHELRRRRVVTPVIAMSAHGDEKLATELMSGGAADFIAKGSLTARRLREALLRASHARLPKERTR